MRLYEAVAQLEVISGWIEEHADEILANGGALTPELEALLTEAEGTLAEKAERVALKVRELQAEAEAVKVEATRLSQRAKTATYAADSLKDYLNENHDRFTKEQRVTLRDALAKAGTDSSKLAEVRKLASEFLA